jgi:hypothetical protein
MPGGKSITYRGVSMTEDWPAKIAEAQSSPTCEIDGEQVPRVRYGAEERDWGADVRPCHDCGVIKGEVHVEDCDVERCAGCGEQRFNCDCEPFDDDDAE